MNEAVLPEDPPVDAYLQVELRNLLGISSADSEEETIRLLLWQLDQADYRPPPVWHEAIDILTGQERVDCQTAEVSFPALHREVEEKLRLEIEDFVSRFTALAPSARRLKWGLLMGSSQLWPHLAARLRLLEPGLEIDQLSAGLCEISKVGRLLQDISQLFPLDVGSRRRLIGEMLAPMRELPQEWERAVFELGRSHPQYANLVPEFVLAITQLCSPEREAKERRDARVPAIAEMTTVAKPTRRERGKPLLSLHFLANYGVYWVYAAFCGIPLLLALIALVCEYALPRPATERPPKSWNVRTSAPEEPPSDETDARDVRNPKAAEDGRQ